MIYVANISQYTPESTTIYAFDSLLLGHAYDVVVDVKSNVSSGFLALRNTPIAQNIWLEISNVTHIYNAISNNDLENTRIYIDEANVEANVIPIYIHTIIDTSLLPPGSLIPNCRFDLYAEAENHKTKYETTTILSASSTHITFRMDELQANTMYDTYYSLYINNPQLHPELLYCTRAHVYIGNVSTILY